MERVALLRSLYRFTALRSARSSAIAEQHLSIGLRHRTSAADSPTLHLLRTFFSLSPNTATLTPRRVSSGDCKPFPTVNIGGIRKFSEDATHLPVITDPDIENVFKDLMAASWDELPDAVIHDAKDALAKDTSDNAGQEALKNLFRAAEAVEEFGGILVSLRMAIDDSVGLSGENVKPMPDEFVNALQVVYKRYTAYLDAFGPEETYLRKKVETELGTKMIHVKMRCSGLGSEWGKVTVLGTSGLSGSYVEHRA